MTADPGHYPWQADIWSTLMTQVDRNRLAHAYLINGPEGTGRLDFARDFAHWLFCEAANKIQTQSACRQCRSCQLWLSGNHPDFFEVTPEAPSKIIKVDAVRALGARINQTSNQAGSKRIIIIQPAEAMATAAANALLKSLEEPPEGVVFLLVANADASLLATIRSRCQPLNLPLPTQSEALAFLETQSTQTSAEQRQSALALAASRPMRAMEMMEAGVPEWFEKMQSLLATLEQGQSLSMEVAKQCEQQPPQYAIPLLLQLLLAKIRNQATTRDQATFQAFSVVWQKVYQAFCEARQELSSTANVNPLMTYEYLFTLWQRAAAITRQIG
jgi:DNA polymerase-3 subunit delta'